MVRVTLLLAALSLATVAEAQTRTPAPGQAQIQAQAQNPAQRPAAGRQSSAQQPVQINADSLDVQQDQKIAVFKGNVDAVQGDLRVKCDTLKVIYSENPKTADGRGGGTSINRLEAIGNVFVSRPDQTGRGERGVYDLDTRIIVLEGNVVLTDKGNIVRGARATMDLNSNQSMVERGANTRVQGVFQPKQSDGKTQ